MGKRKIRILSSMVLIMVNLSLSKDMHVKRGRYEGTRNISASNVAGNGNIFFATGLNSSYWKSGFVFDPGVLVGLGIADILQLKATSSFTNFKKLGSTQIHAQITTPGNNILRFFGVSLCGEVHLSTFMDTLTGDAISGKPEFRSFIRPSLIADLDFLAINKRCKLKWYLELGMVDNAELLTMYDQLSVVSGWEWKLYKNSFFMDLGIGLYREKKSNLYQGDNGYKQQTVWVEPGVRYRIANRLSLLTSLKATLVTRVNSQRPLPAHFAGLNVALELPVVYKETNTEAIRSLVFIEEQKNHQKDRITRSIEQGKKIKTDFELDLEEFSSEKSISEQEKETLKKKEEIQQKMDELESLLKGL